MTKLIKAWKLDSPEIVNELVLLAQTTDSTNPFGEHTPKLREVFKWMLFVGFFPFFIDNFFSAYLHGTSFSFFVAYFFSPPIIFCRLFFCRL